MHLVADFVSIACTSEDQLQYVVLNCPTNIERKSFCLIHEVDQFHRQSENVKQKIEFLSNFMRIHQSIYLSRQT